MCFKRVYYIVMQRYYVVDFFRGLAAFLVLISHYGHFFQYKQNGYPKGWSDQLLPLNDYIGFIYNQGGKAVEFFFCISGFIFFMYYFEKVSDKKISPLNFFLLRFSRLYPLHIVSLIIVAIFTVIFFNLSDFYFIYDKNDLKHFILNIFLISHWGFQDGTSFNEPIWSVSIEIFLYGAFFILSYYLRNILLICVSSILIGLIITLNVYYSFGVGIVCFFIGGLTFYLHKYAITKRVEHQIFSLTLLLFLIVTYIIFLNPYSLNIYKQDLLAFFILFPLLVLILSFIDLLKINFFKKVSIFGDLSYSIYIIHFPLQLIIVTMCLLIGFDINFSKVSSLFGYMLLTLLISFFSYKYLEVPMRNYFRKYIS